MNKDEEIEKLKMKINFYEVLVKKQNDKLEKIKKLLEESNVLASPDCRLFLEDGRKIINVIKE